MEATLVSSHRVTTTDLMAIEVPQQTKSYVPVSHNDFIDNVKDMSSRILPNYMLHSEQYGIARDGKQMFGAITYKQELDEPVSNEMGLSIGLRNSYDKSMSLGLCAGSTVFVCENLMMSGEVVVMRMHKGSILDELKGLIFNTLINAEGKFQTLNNEAQGLKQYDIDNQFAYSLMGRLYGNGIITERQMPVMKREWHKPKHDAFEGRTAWSLYNAGTEALKTTPPMHRMKRQIEMHNMFTGIGDA